MQQYVERMIRERDDLSGKIKKAVKAVKTQPYGMNKTQIMLLSEQIKCMESYLDILNQRIEYETKKVD